MTSGREQWESWPQAPGRKPELSLAGDHKVPVVSSSSEPVPLYAHQEAAPLSCPSEMVAGAKGALYLKSA